MIYGNYFISIIWVEVLFSFWKVGAWNPRQDFVAEILLGSFLEPKA